MSTAGDGDQYGVTADDTAETTVPKLYAALEKAEAQLDEANKWISVDEPPTDADEMVLWRLTDHPRKVICMSLRETAPAGVDVTGRFNGWMRIPTGGNES